MMSPALDIQWTHPLKSYILQITVIASITAIEFSAYYKNGTFNFSFKLNGLLFVSSNLFLKLRLRNKALKKNPNIENITILCIAKC